MDSSSDQELPGTELTDSEMREIAARLSERFSEANIEDWDFRDPNLSTNDAAADLFVSMNYVNVVAVDLLRIQYIDALLRTSNFELSEDGQHVLLTGSGRDDFWRGFTGGGFRESLTAFGRQKRRVRQSLEREWRKYGHLKLTILPRGSAARASEFLLARGDLSG